VSARSAADPDYGPEVHVCSFLDARFPERAPHHAYAHYARAFSVDRLSRVYQTLMREHAVDALVLVDGGSDSLMVGDEAGLGDPVEDAVSVAAVASLQGLKARILVAVGLGADRFNDVSDASTLRAVAELTRSGGYLGAVSLEPTGPGFELYRACIGHVNARQTFRSVIAGTIVAATRGEFGRERLPPELADRVQVDSVFLWPLMAMLWAFDVERVAERSLLVRWVRGCESQLIASAAVEEARRHLGPRLRGVEDLPRHGEMRRPTGRG